VGQVTSAFSKWILFLWVAAALAICWPHSWLLALGVAALPLSVILGWQSLRFAAMRRDERERRLAVFETDYGRSAGWYVEYQGQRLALLTDPRFEDMFWVSYSVEPLVEDPDQREEMLSSRDWWLGRKLEFRNKDFHEVASFAFPAGDTFPEPGRVSMRGLYLCQDDPNWWEACVLWARRRTRKRAR
jgi:hypothetical protein